MSPPLVEEIFTLRLPVCAMSATLNSPRPLCVVVRQPTGLPSLSSSKDGLRIRLAGDSLPAAVLLAGLKLESTPLIKLASLRAAALVGASGIHRSSPLRGSCRAAETADPAPSGCRV